MTVSPEHEKYREWVKTCYKPTIFIPKTIVYANPINSPVYQVAGGVASHQFISQTSNGRPPLLPTPPSPYSPRVNLITSPYAAYTPTTTFGFFEAAPTGSAGIQPTLIIPAVSGATANMRDGTPSDIVSTQISTLQLNPSSPAGEMVMSPQPQVHYVMPTNNAYIQQQHQQHHNVVTQQSFTPSSPTKSIPTSLNIGPLSTILQRMNSHNSNQNNNKKSNSSSNYYNNNNNKWNSSSSNNSQNNSARNSQRNSPKSSPKMNSRAFSYPQQQPIMQLQQLQQYVIPTAPIQQDSLAVVAGTTVTTMSSDKRQESRIYYTAEQLRNLNPKANLKEDGQRHSERVPVEEFDPSALITEHTNTITTRQQQHRVSRNSNTAQQQNGSTNVNSNSNKDVIVISDGE